MPSVRQVISVVAATAIASLGLTATSSPSSASASETAAEPCPAKTVCLYDGRNFTGLLYTITAEERWLAEFPPEIDNRTSSIINNETLPTDALFIFADPFLGTSIGSVRRGTTWVAPPQYDNRLSSMYLY